MTGARDPQDAPVPTGGGPDGARPEVVVVGSANWDLTVHAERHPLPGETILAADLTEAAGGKGANQAVAAAWAGARTAMVARIGEDSHGDGLLEGLRRAGVDTAWVRRTPGRPSGTAIVQVAGDGQNTIVVVPGANAALDAAEVEDALEALLGAGSVALVQVEIPVPAVEAVLRTAERLGARAAVNLSPSGDLDPAALALADPLIVNESEAAALWGRPVDDLDAARRAVAELSRRCRSVVLTLGSAGALWARAGDEAEHVPPVPATVVDTSGAGDAFAGALVAALARGEDLGAAVHAGARAGAVAVGRHGAQLTRDGEGPGGRDVAP